MGRIRIGLSSWTDKSLIECGKFYPPAASDAESRLRYYASQFPDLVEVNSTYYGLPSERNALYWDQRTPAGFLFDVKLFSLFTHHPTEVRGLPRDIAGALPKAIAEKGRLYFKDVPAELSTELLQRFVRALAPLHQAGKLGAVLLQFPRWFPPGTPAQEHLDWLKAGLGDYLPAVEFRNKDWLREDSQAATFDFLRGHGFAYVCVDEPQGFPSSVPPVAVATHPGLAYVRFHGRRAETWEKPGVTVQERTEYLYTTAELAEWVPRLRQLAEASAEVHVLMNTNYEDYAVRNARQLQWLLD